MASLRPEQLPAHLGKTLAPAYLLHGDEPRIPKSIDFSIDYLLPGRARDQGRWMDDAKLMLEAGTTAYQAARRKDVAALDALSDQLMSSCITCHQDYRPTYRRRIGRAHV